jgi:hypothetical protein
MSLTAAQIEAIKHGEPVTVESSEVGTECVVLRADVYARVKRLIDDNADPYPVKAYPLINEVMREVDAHDPWLESYQTP